MSDSLFNPNPNKTIDAFDLFGKKHKRNLKNCKFRISVYGVLFNGDRILAQRNPKLKQFGLPGGGVEIGETIKSALAREFKEETGLEVKVGKLITVSEDYFTYKDEDAHSILITYEVKRKGGNIMPEGNQNDTEEVKFLDLENFTVESTQRVFWPIIKTIKSKKY